MSASKPIPYKRWLKRYCPFCRKTHSVKYLLVSKKPRIFMYRCERQRFAYLGSSADRA